MNLTIVEQALLGQFPSFLQGESVFEKINQILINQIEKDSSLGLEKFQNQLISSKSNLEDVKLIASFFEIPLLNISDYSKNKEISSKLREYGNSYFKSKNYERAERAYNLSILFAPIDSTELGLAYGNRSALSFEIAKTKRESGDISKVYNLYNMCEADIQKALESQLHYPEELKEKILKRKLKCLQKIEEIRKSNEFKNMKIKEIIMNNIREDVFNIQNLNEQMPSCSNVVKMIWSCERGRELIANEDISSGTTLLVEKPFVRILKNSTQWDIRHCHHCLKNITSISSIPCNSCVFALYCSEECRNDAFEKYHNFECFCLPLMHYSAAPRYLNLTLRLISLIGPNDAYKYFKNEKLLQGVAPDKNGIINLNTEKYLSSCYIPIYNLVSHHDKLDSVEKFANISQALFILHCLKNRTNFFKNLKLEKEELSFELWLGALTLHHLQNLPCNSISLDELKIPIWPITPDEIKKAQLCQYSSGVFSTISLLNHSCDANSTRLNDETGKIAIVSLRNIKKGEPITTSYTVSFLRDSLEKRRNHLISTYFFNCLCRACIENWPALEELKKFSPEFACKTHSLTKNCNSKCKKKQKKDFSEICQNFKVAYEHVLENRPQEGVSEIKKVLDYYSEKVIAPYSEAMLAQDILKRAYDLIFYFTNLLA